MMMHKFEVDKNNGVWELFEIESEKTKEFSSMEEIVSHLKQDTSKFTVLDIIASGIAHFENGEVERVEAEYGECDDHMNEFYLDMKSSDNEDNEDYEIDCHHCGDGGCIYCDPAMFL